MSLQLETFLVFIGDVLKVENELLNLRKRKIKSVAIGSRLSRKKLPFATVTPYLHALMLMGCAFVQVHTD